MALSTWLWLCFAVLLGQQPRCVLAQANTYRSDDLLLGVCGNASRPAWSAGGEPLTLVHINAAGGVVGADGPAKDIALGFSEGLCDAANPFVSQPWSASLTNLVGVTKRYLLLPAYDNVGLSYGTSDLSQSNRGKALFQIEQTRARSVVSLTEIKATTPGIRTIPCQGLHDPNALSGAAIALRSNGASSEPGLFRGMSLVKDYSTLGLNPSFLALYGADEDFIRVIGGTGAGPVIYAYTSTTFSTGISYLTTPLAITFAYVSPLTGPPAWASAGDITAVTVHANPTGATPTYWMWTGRANGPSTGISVERWVSTISANTWNYHNYRVDPSAFDAAYTGPGASSGVQWVITGLATTTLRTDSSSWLFIAACVQDDAAGATSSSLWRLKTTDASPALQVVTTSAVSKFTGIARAPFDFATAEPTPNAAPSPSPSSSLPPSGSLTASVSPSKSVSGSTTASGSASPSYTRSSTASASVTPSQSRSFSLTASSTLSASVSASITASQSASASVEPTASVTVSPGSSASSSNSVQASPSASKSVSNSQTGSASRTASSSASASLTASMSASPTGSSSASASASGSASATPSSSTSVDPTPSVSASQGSSASSTRSVEATVSAAASPSPTVSSSLSPSVTPSFTSSPSVSPSATDSSSQSASVSPSQGASVSVTPTPSPTPSVSSTPSIVLARVNPPANSGAIPDSRYYSLLSSSSSSSSSASSALSTAAGSSTFANLVIAEVLPAATFSLVFPFPPSANEEVTVACAPAGLLAQIPGIAVSGVSGQSVSVLTSASGSGSAALTAANFASLPTSSLSFGVSASFSAVPFASSVLSTASTMVSAGPIATGSVQCSFTSRDITGGGGSLSYRGLPSLFLPVKWLSTSWPLFGDMVVEDDNVNVTALRSSWGASSVATESRLRFSVPNTDPPAHVATVISNAGPASNNASRVLPGPAATLLKRYSLPASLVNPFTLTISGSTTVTLVRDTWQWTHLAGSSSSAEAAISSALDRRTSSGNASSLSSLQLALPPHLSFHNGTRVFVGAAECKVLQVSSDGALLRIRTPSFKQICGQDPAEVAASGSDCGVKPLTIVNPSLLQVPPYTASPASSDILTLARGGPQGAALEASLLQRYRDTIAAGFPPPSALGAMTGCPQFCPGLATAALSPCSFPVLVVASSSAASATGGNSLSLVPQGLSPSELASSSTFSAATVSQQAGGIAITVKCTGAQWERVPSTDVCLNASNPDSRRCPFGSGDQCSACPVGAVCPNQRAFVTQGYWSATPSSGAIIPCPYPSTRCGGYDPVSGVATCSTGYKQGSFLCSQCDAAARYYPSEEGSGATCVPCPASIDFLTIVRPLLLLVGSMIAIGVAMGFVVVLVSRRNGGTVAGGLRRTAQFVLSIIGVLQLIIQVGNAAKPGLPLLVTRFYAALSLLQFQGITLHPNCVDGPLSIPFQQQIAEMGIALALTLVCALSYLNYRRLCGCYCCGVGKKATAMLQAAPPRGDGLELISGFPSDQKAAATAAAVATSLPSRVASWKHDGGMPKEKATARALPELPMVAEGASDKMRTRRATTELGGPRRFRGAGVNSAGVPLSIRCGRRMDVYKPLIRRVTLTIMGVIYATIVNACLGLLPCKSGVAMTVAAYLTLDQDGSTIRKQYPGTTAQDYASPCADQDCLTRNPLYDKLLSVSLLSSNGSFVCYEGSHLRAAVLAWFTFAVFAVLFPLASYLLVRRRILQIMTASHSPMKQLYEAALRNDSKRRALYIRGERKGGAESGSKGAWSCLCSGLGRRYRCCCARLCGLGSRFDYNSEPDSACACRRKPAQTFKSGASSTPAVAPLQPPIRDGFLSAVPMIGITASAMQPVALTGSDKNNTANPLLLGVRGSPSSAAGSLPGSVRLRIVPYDGSAALKQQLSNETGGEDNDHRTLLLMVAAGLANSSTLPGSFSAASPQRKSFLLTGKGGGNSKADAVSKSPLSSLSSQQDPKEGGLVPPAAAFVLTANGLIDGYDLVSHRNPSLAYFTAGDYRASRWWFRQEDMMLLLYLGILAAWWPNNTLESSSSALGLLLLTVAAVLLEGVMVIIKRPYTRESQWLIVVRLLTILMAGAAAAMNYANEVSPLAAAGEQGGGDSDNGDRPLLIVILAYLVFALSIALASAVVVSFLLSLRAGARKEQVDSKAAEAAERERRKMGPQDALASDRKLNPARVAVSKAPASPGGRAAEASGPAFQQCGGGGLRSRSVLLSLRDSDNGAGGDPSTERGTGGSPSAFELSQRQRRASNARVLGSGLRAAAVSRNQFLPQAQARPAAQAEAAASASPAYAASSSSSRIPDAFPLAIAGLRAAAETAEGGDRARSRGSLLAFAIASPSQR